jgi:hypothetical protein
LSYHSEVVNDFVSSGRAALYCMRCQSQSPGELAPVMITKACYKSVFISVTRYRIHAGKREQLDGDSKWYTWRILFTDLTASFIVWSMRGLNWICGFDLKRDLMYIGGEQPSAIHYFRHIRQPFCVNLQIETIITLRSVVFHTDAYVLSFAWEFIFYFSEYPINHKFD